jgi:hypothetical protein
MKGQIQLNRRIAVLLALVGFVIVMVMGLCGANPLENTLQRALYALIGGYVFGRIVGGLSERFLAEVNPPTQTEEVSGEPSAPAGQAAAGKSSPAADRTPVARQVRNQQAPAPVGGGPSR